MESLLFIIAILAVIYLVSVIWHAGGEKEAPKTCVENQEKMYFSVLEKLCTDLNQSKRLIELGLDISTADMIYSADDKGNYTLEILNSPVTRKNYSIRNGYRVPSWSLPKLLDMLPPRLYYHGEEYFMEFFKTPKGEWVIQYPKQGTLFPIVCHQESFDSPIDAIYQMVCYLQEELDDEFTKNKPDLKE